MKVRIGFLLVAFLLGGLLLDSCKKKEEDSLAIVTVKTISNQRANGATVRLTADGDGVNTVVIDETEVTNSRGEAYFDFSEFYELGQTGLAVLDVYASYPSTTTDTIPDSGGGDSIITVPTTLTGQGIIKLVEEETTEKSIIVQ